MGRKRTIDRDALLDIAEAIVIEQGAGKLSFDEIARRAGVSKGGVLYCFPNKQELVAAMARRDVERFDKDVATHKAEDGDDMLAHLAATRDENRALASKAASLMAALAEAPEHAEPIREHYRRLLGRFGADNQRARTILFAAEGAFLLRGLGLVGMSDEEWAALFKDMARLYEEAEEAARIGT